MRETSWVICSILSNPFLYSSKRIRKLWMDRIIAASVPITEFGMAPCFVPRIEKAAACIAAFTNLNLAVHGPIYNGFITTAVNALQ